MNTEEILQTFEGFELIQDKEQYCLLGKPVGIPWLIIVPKINISLETEKMIFNTGLKIKHLLSEHYPKHVYNLAKIGNKTSTYHLHLLFRNSNDLLWPEPAWCKEQVLQTDNQHINKIKEILNNAK